MKRPLTLALSLLLAAGLAACTAPTPPDSALPDGAASTPGAEPGAPVGEQRPLSPLEAFEYEIYGLNASAQEREQREYDISVQVEDLVAECMKAEGFEYTPQPSRPDLSEPGVSVDGVSDENFDDRDWVTRYGYGMVETPQRAMGETLDAGIPKGSDAGTPNQQYRATLSSTEEAAYDLAMNGPAQTEENFSLANAGCWGQSVLAVEGEDPSELDEHEPILEAMDEFWNTAGSWPGLAELDSSWASCMAGRGHGGYSRQGDALDDIAAKNGALWETANPDGGSRLPVEQTPPPMAALQALAEQERELAIIDFECREEVDYRARYDAIAFAEETRFMSDHKPALDALKAAYELRGER